MSFLLSFHSLRWKFFQSSGSSFKIFLTNLFNIYLVGVFMKHTIIFLFVLFLTTTTLFAQQSGQEEVYPPKVEQQQQLNTQNPPPSLFDIPSEQLFLFVGVFYIVALVLLGIQFKPNQKEKIMRIGIGILMIGSVIFAFNGIEFKLVFRVENWYAGILLSLPVLIVIFSIWNYARKTKVTGIAIQPAADEELTKSE
ncbi:hypothetical protein K9L27_00970 [Candidatus Gracilibacteria bacterium]|nr:hypothetical protein [Candidatus Gracilibacteria bacterium]